MSRHAPPTAATGATPAPGLTELQPYGDIWRDGVIQFAFTLPVPPSPEAKEAAAQILKAHDFHDVQIAEMAEAARGFSFFVGYAASRKTIDFTKIKVPKVTVRKLDRPEVESLIRDKIGRRIIVVGACTGADAHTVGIDAIMNSKGYAGDYGLERYEMFDTHNLGAQVENETLVKKVLELNADVLLVSKIITQRDIHVDDLRDLMMRIDAAGLRTKLLTLIGGPRISHKLAKELGYDAGFGRNTTPGVVATWIADQLIARKEGAPR